MISLSLLLLLVQVCAVRAQSSASAYSEPTVPTGEPIPGDYSGALRPQVHYSPPVDFMVSRCGGMVGASTILSRIDPS